MSVIEFQRTVNPELPPMTAFVLSPHLTDMEFAQSVQLPELDATNKDALPVPAANSQLAAATVLSFSGTEVVSYRVWQD